MIARILTLALLWCTLLVAAPGATANSLLECTGITDDGARLACFDAVAENVVRAEEKAGPAIDSAITIAPEIDELLFGKRLAEEAAITGNAWVITPHERNYLLPLTYATGINQDAWDLKQPNSSSARRVETKFQISLKTLLKEDILGAGSNLWVAYTQENWWQVYKSSSPFRETNYQPELTLAFDNDWRFRGFTNTVVSLSLNHQSNGQGGDLSRSWNRIVAAAVLERERMSLIVRSWYRIPESSNDDDNPDIDDYYGYGDIKGIWKWREHEFAVKLRNNLQRDNRGAVELEWSFPINRRFKGYVQYFNGYGESLIDYNQHGNRLGVGISMTDLL
ncbi:phospholipase [Kineobactrum sediminis]|uniref:Phospholipase A1 n=1 Tax=Kineobactrum sediminis TaxID=1905677 RepID=A0A2N5Y460_9GAMM|nr:phospholipase A [Kineobactrum sediminis]PLW83174.1 phospholipase [Kineobactrum sediminis]